MMESVDTKVAVHYDNGGVRHGEDSLWCVFEGTPRGSGEACHGGRPEHTGSGAEIVDPDFDGAAVGEAIHGRATTTPRSKASGAR